MTSTRQDMDKIFETIHTVQQPRRTRDPEKPMQVICCGFPRTGTESLSKALAILGYEGVYHGSLLPVRPGDCAAWAEAVRLRANNDSKLESAAFWDQILGECQAITDLPGAA